MRKTTLVFAACTLVFALASDARAAGSEKKATPGQVAKEKFKVLWRAVKQQQGLDAIKAAAKELADAQRVHGLKTEMANNADYLAKCKACADAIDKVAAAESVHDASTASRGIGRSCMACHKVYNKKK